MWLLVENTWSLHSEQRLDHLKDNNLEIYSVPKPSDSPGRDNSKCPRVFTEEAPKKKKENK